MATPPPLGLPPLPPNIGAIVGPTLLGCLLNFLFFGMLAIQVYVYTACFPADRAAIKALVYAVFFSMLVCTCLNAADAHYWFAAGFGNIVKFGEPRFSAFYTPLFGSVVGLAVQLFFAYRISVFRRAGWVSVLVILISLMQAAGGMGGGIKAYIASNVQHDNSRTILVYMWLVGSAVSDVVIAITMTLLLMNASEPTTRHIIKRVVRLIIETNAFSASVAIIGLVLFAGLPGTTYFICPTMILPGIYSNTLLVVLNNRASPDRANFQENHTTNTADFTYNNSHKNTSEYRSSHKYAESPNKGARRVYSPDTIPIGEFPATPRGGKHGRESVDRYAHGRGSIDKYVGSMDTHGFSYGRPSTDKALSPTHPTPTLGRNGAPAVSAVSWGTISVDSREFEEHPYGSAGTYTKW